MRGQERRHSLGQSPCGRRRSRAPRNRPPTVSNLGTAGLPRPNRDIRCRLQDRSTQVLSHQLFPQPDGVMAKVRVSRTVFERASVVPKKSEVWMTWMPPDGRCRIRPQEQI
jgi:hypothetical protein